MKTLMLDENRIQQLPESLFLSLRLLQVLKLGNNQITTVYSNSFTGLVGLRELDLSGNRIPMLPLGIFDPLGHLETLLLTNNEIHHIESTPFHSCRNLRTLDIANNLLSHVSAHWFVPTTKLLVLKLAHNRIKTIEAQTFNPLQELVELDLKENHLSFLRNNMFTSCRSLKKLNLTRNPLRRLASPGTPFAGLTTLRQLDLTGCCIADLVLSASSPLPALTELYLGGNLLRTLRQRSFEAAAGLQKLDLDDNIITTVQGGALSSLSSLRSLNLSRNFLTGDQLATAVRTLSSNVIVDASRNRVASLSSLGNRLGGIYLSGNPLVCTCTSPSWISLADSSRLLDASRTLCSSGSEREYLLCHWSRCDSRVTDHQLCSASIPSDMPSGSNLSSKVCRLDSALVVFGPKFTDFNAHALSPTSAKLRWNISDEFNTVGGFKFTFAALDDCTNASAAFSFLNETSRNSTVHNDDIRLRTTNIGNLNAGGTYVMCAHVLKTVGSRNRTSVSDSRCTCLELPDKGKETEAVSSSTSIATTPSTRVPVTDADAFIRATWNDTAISVTWVVVENSTAQYAYFRLTCFDEASRQVVSTEVRGYSYVIGDLTRGSTYNVCVTAVTHGDDDDLTRCVTVRTDDPPRASTASPSTEKTDVFLLSAVAASCGALLLALIIVCICAIVCYRRRRRNKRPSATAPSVYDTATMNGFGGHAGNGSTTWRISSPLAEQATTVMNMYSNETEIDADGHVQQPGYPVSAPDAAWKRSIAAV